MKRILSYTVVSLALFGCQAAGAEEMGNPGASAPKGPRVGTEPGKVGNGTPLTAQPGHELAAFAGGCFWGVEDAFRKVPGVTATAVGFTGGHTKNPTYPKVCEHDTGHAETVLVEFDPVKIPYDKLLAVFFRIHDPTTLNSQGPDYGDQYRSAIFTFSPIQAAAAAAAITRTQNEIHQKVVTVVSPIGQFWKAEAYHQQYAERTGTHGCPVRGFTGVI
ncbi:MAG TPA: peptide-methionine (S)-S-oxide reductase MsrA [Polyangiaceae bacterium]|jgi:peptide-methionine (S)-S-oxide reductase|nr:peptide-methionine (S)-S-oxide reductase MsrA [Polyangiaceae bacterium]